MAIKVGDKVKATLGDSLVVGHVMSIRPTYGVTTGYIAVKPVGGGDAAESVFWDGDGWTIEVIQDLPTKVGAVVRGSDGSVYVKAYSSTPYNWLEIHGPHAGDAWGDDTVAEGGFEILFGGVDE